MSTQPTASKSKPYLSKVHTNIILAEIEPATLLRTSKPITTSTAPQKSTQDKYLKFIQACLASGIEPAIS